MTVPFAACEQLIGLLRFLEQEGGSLGIHRLLAESGNNVRAGWTIALEFGQEAEDSNMAAGASYAAEENLLDALRRVAKEVRI